MDFQIVKMYEDKVSTKMSTIFVYQCVTKKCFWHLLHWVWCCFENCFTCFVQVLLYILFFTVFRLLTDFVCLYTYEFWLSLCKIVRSSVILLLPSLAIVLSVFSYLFLWSLYCLSLRTFSFGHCIVCLIVPFSLIIVLSVFIRFTASHFQPSFLVFVYCK